MSVPSIVKGGYFTVAVEAVPGSGTYTAICGLNARTLTHQINTADEAVPDCDNPEQIPWRIMNSTSQQKDIGGTGLHNRAQSDLIRQIYGKTLNYRFIEGEPFNDAVSQGYWQGPFKFTNWVEGANDGANVTSQFSFGSDGQIIWVPTVAVVPTLAALTATPLTATTGQPWTATISGKTQNSVITASSPGVTLSVTDNIVSGTFPTAGSKTVTLVETLAGATGSPKTGTQTVVVSAP